MARRKDHSREELKEMILETAYKIVGEEGYSALTARRIAGDIGYAPGTIYNLFESMDALVLHLNILTMQNLYAVLNKTKDGQETGKALNDMAKRYYAFSQDHKNHWLMLFQNQAPEGGEYPEWFSNEVAKIFEPLEGILAAHYSNQKDLKMAARGLWASMHGIIYLEATGKIPKVDPSQKSAPASALTLVNFMIGEFIKERE